VRRSVLALTAVGALLCSTAAAAAPSAPPYLRDDFSKGQTFSILPPGEHGLYNASDLVAFEATGRRPTGASDQFSKYENLPASGRPSSAARTTAAGRATC